MAVVRTVVKQCMQKVPGNDKVTLELQIQIVKLITLKKEMSEEWGYLETKRDLCALKVNSDRTIEVTFEINKPYLFRFMF